MATAKPQHDIKHKEDGQNLWLFFFIPVHLFHLSPGQKSLKLTLNNQIKMEQTILEQR